MRLPLLKQVILASILASPIAARADTIDDFTFTSSSHTISYSLPATLTSVIVPPPSAQEFGVYALATIDGVSGYQVSAVYYLPPFPSELWLYVPPSIFGTNEISFGAISGPRFFSLGGCPSCPPDITAITFAPGTYALGSASASRISLYTLTITQEAATTPEPSSLVLLATGLTAPIGVALARHRRRTSPRSFAMDRI